MNIAPSSIHGVAEGVECVETTEDLKHFLNAACSAAIWQRQPTLEFQSWIDGLDPDGLPNGRCVLHRSEVRQAVMDFCEIAQTPQCAERDHLIDDVTTLSEIFTDLMRVDHLRLRLETVTTNACQKFHVDAITARLVCTYRGSGTQYGEARGNADPEHVFDTPTGAPILLRGSLWPDDPPSGLLQRSPPIEGTGETRLVLVLDPVFDPRDAQ